MDRSDEGGRGRARPRRADGGGGLFAATERPVVAHAAGTVSRVNPAFGDAFDVADAAGQSLSALLEAVIADGQRAVLDAIDDETDEPVRCVAETVDGERRVDVRTVSGDGHGYLVFEAVDDGRLDVLQYLTHSLRNPLEAATVHADVMAETGSLDHVETVRAAHERMAAILEDGVAFARQRAPVADADPVDVAAVAREAWETTRTDGATLRVADPGTVRADRRRLAALFETLFDNAVRHGPPEGADAAALTVTVEGVDGGFAVADDGRGIGAADRDQVFDAGFSTAEAGTGLGLAIVAEIADQHGWERTVTESEDGGARFEFRPAGD